MNPRVMKYAARVGFDVGQYTWFDLSDLPKDYEPELMDFAKEIGWFEKRFKLDEFLLPSNDLAIIFEHPGHSQDFVFTYNKLVKVNFDGLDHTYEGPAICAYLHHAPDPNAAALLCNDINTRTGGYLHLRPDLHKSFEASGNFSRMYDLLMQEMTSPFIALSLLNRKALVSQSTLTAYRGEEKSSFINKKRRAKNKPPIFNWTTVELKPSAPRREHQGGTHASPARHERRGHFRKYPSGKIAWVRPTWVGSIERGMTVHDYIPGQELLPSQARPEAS
jgi:hypothetical protein